MNTRLLFLLAAALALPASAQVYKCKTPTGGTLVSDRPCDGANKTVDVRRSEPVTLEQQMQAAEVQQRRRQQLGQIQAEEAAHRARLAERQAQRAEQEAIQAENAHNPRGGEKEAFDPADAIRYNERTVAERSNARLKDEFGGKTLRVQGPVKVMSHLMFGVLALSADQLMRLRR